MTRKQKNALALSGLLLVWGVVLWRQHGGSSGSQEKAEAASKPHAVDEATPDAMAPMAAHPDDPAPGASPVYQSIRTEQVKIAAEPWTRDPFSPITADAEEKAPNPPRQQTVQAKRHPASDAPKEAIIRLTSTFKTPTGYFAMINGKSCKVGDVIHGTSRLVAIGDGWIDVDVNDPERADEQALKRITMFNISGSNQ